MWKSMNVLIDTNVVLDVLLDREPHADASNEVLRLCEAGILNGSFAALSVANLVYIMRKQLDPDSVETILGTLEVMLAFTELRVTDLKKAASMKWKDFEDAVQSVTAKRLKADYIVTRNVKDFKESDIPAITPVDLLVQLGIQ